MQVYEECHALCYHLIEYNIVSWIMQIKKWKVDHHIDVHMVIQCLNVDIKALNKSNENWNKTEGLLILVFV